MGPGPGLVLNFSTRYSSVNMSVNLFSVELELGIPHKTRDKKSIHDEMALRFAGLGSVVERPATKAATAQDSLSAARRDARSDVAHIAPEVAAAYTLRMTRTRVVFRCDQNIMRAMRRGRGVRAGSSRENLRFSSWMSDQYFEKLGFFHFRISSCCSRNP